MMYQRSRLATISGFSLSAVASLLLSLSSTAAWAQTFTGQDVGAVTASGTDSYNSSTGVYTLQGNGADIWGTADAFHFVYQTITGDGELVARVTSVQNTNSWAKAGVMVRQSTAAGSIQAMAVQTPGNGVAFQYRTLSGGNSTNLDFSDSGAPHWVKIVKDGNIVTSYQSTDATSWTFMGCTELPFTGPVEIGLVVCSHTTNHTLCTATFDNVSLVQQTSYAPPAPWVDQDIGSTGLAGQVHYEATQWTMYASGADIWNAADAFHFAYQPLTGDGSIIAQVSAVSNTNAWTKAGVMIRQDLTAGSAHATVVVTPGNGVAFQYRRSAGGSSSTIAGASVTAPYWVKLTRSGNQFYAYQSPDGITWQQLGVQTINMPQQVYMGLAESSHNNNALAVGFFDSVQTLPVALTVNNHTDTGVNLIWPSLADPALIADYEIDRNGVAVGTSLTTNFEDIQLTPSTTYTYQIKALGSGGQVLATSTTLSFTTDAPWLPSPWTHFDIGQVNLGGSSEFDPTTGIYTLIGSGADIWGGADAFQFANQSLSGDGQIIARVKSVTPTNSWSKAGIMLRETSAPGSKNVLLALTPGNGVTFQQRTTTGGNSTYSALPATGPVWLKLIRSGSAVTADTSTDGINWSLMGSTSITLNTTLEAGLALTSHDITKEATSVIDNVSVTAGIPTETQPPTAPGTPTTVAVGDVSATIQWPAATDTVGVIGYQVYRNGQLVAQTGSIRQFTDTGLTPGQSYAYTVTATNFGGLVSTPSVALQVTTTSSGLPSPWIHQEIGTVALAGTSSSTGSAFTISASGDDIWNSADAFGYVYQTLTGDGQITARVSGLTNPNAWAKAGVMLRQSLDPGSPNVFMLVSASNGLSFQTRTTQGASSSNQAGAHSVAPAWVRLVRSGSVLTGYSSADGVTWTYVAQRTLTLNSTLYAGLAVTSHHNGVLATGTFDNVAVVPANSLPPTPVNLTVIYGSTTATLNWSDAGSGILNFTLQYSTDGGATWSTLTTVPGSTTSVTVTGLTLGANYSFRISASNGSGSSSPSTADAAPILTLSAPVGATLVP